MCDLESYSFPDPDKTFSLPKLTVRKLNPHAFLPAYQSEKAAGMDLRILHGLALGGGARAKMHTGIAIQMPPGHFGRILPRSSMAIKGLDTKAGVIDPDYRGEVMVVLHNTTRETYHIEKGDRIAQLVIQPYAHCDVRFVDSLNETDRGKGGFGSTGV